MPHSVLCKRLFGYGLTAFLGREHLGVRVKMHGEEVAVEGYDKPNSQQHGKINSMLRHNDIFRLVTCFRGSYDVRTTFTKPIRKL